MAQVSSIFLLVVTAVTALGCGGKFETGPTSSALGAGQPNPTNPSGAVPETDPQTSTAPPAPGPNAIVLRYADFPPPTSTGTGTSSTSGGSTLDPDTQFIILGNGPQQCTDPYAAEDCGQWRVYIGVPPALFHTGSIALSEIVASHSVRGPDRGGGDCYGGGGSFSEGNVEILNIDDEHVSVRLVDTLKLDFDADGDYSAARCK